ncbi:MAG: nucleoside kinase [Candidatus Fimimorpha sp.]
MVKVFINQECNYYEEHTTYLEIAQQYQHQYSNDIILVVADHKLMELRTEVKDGATIKFLTTAEREGMQTYQRSVVFLMLKAFYEVVGSQIECIKIYFSLSKGLYCEARCGFEVTAELLAQVKTKMQQLVQADLPITKQTIDTKEAMERFHQYKMYDKEALFHFRRNSRVNIYRLDGFEDYFYGYMAPSTKMLRYFDLFLYDKGFVLQLPVKEYPKQIPVFVPQNRIYEVMKESYGWSRQLEAESVGELNRMIARGKMNDLILVQEALMEKKIAELAEQITETNKKKFVMIAGPSSSGKTTFSHRLSIQLKAIGMKPHIISVDDYFHNREKSPRDEKGNYDFEAIECIDMKQFNEDMNALLHGKTVSMPTYNFITGVREYKGRTLSMRDNDILIIEGIHCLNDRLTATLPIENKFKIYISALTQLNVDEHNRIPSTDGRLLRRIVRDARTRGTSAKETIARWYSVRRGEERNIFPYQESADVMFNSALVYELAVIKQYAEPLLFHIQEKDAEYQEAKRLLKFLDYFLGVSSEDIPQNSILREFIGGSCFKV